MDTENHEKNQFSFLSCPKCQCQIWNDIPNTKNGSRTRFRCTRCGKLIRLTGCSSCASQENWVLIKGIEEKSGWRPYYRFQCKSCGRHLGVLIDIWEPQTP
jgi:ribosomal protein S14